MVIEFVRESDLAFHESCAAGFHVGDDFLLMPHPSRKGIARLGHDLEIRDWGFFKGDQQVSVPYVFEQPLAVAPCPEGGFYVCDAASPNLLFFDEKGIFEYAKSPPGILEVAFRRPVNVATDALGLAVVEEDMTLHLIDAMGEHRAIHLSQQACDGTAGRVCLDWHGGKVYLLPRGGSLLCVDPVSGSVECLEISAPLSQGTLEAFCFDTAGRLYVATSDPTSLAVLDPGFKDTVAAYDRFGYGEGCIRCPRCLSVDPTGFLYLIDDSRILLFRLVQNAVGCPEAGEGSPSTGIDQDVHVNDA